MPRAETAPTADAARVPAKALLVLPLAVLACLATHAILMSSRLLKPLAPRLQLSVRNATFRAWGRTLCWLLGMRVTVVGTPPTGSFLLVSNHLSYLDVMLLSSRVDSAYVAKAGLRKYLFRVADTVYVNRRRRGDVRRVIGQIEGCFERGLGVVLFPEGTTSDGQQIRRLKPSILEVAVALDRPVHYATLSYRTPAGQPPAHRAVCWADGSPFVQHLLRLLRLPYFEATLCFGEEPVYEADRKVLARELEAAMERIFTPVP